MAGDMTKSVTCAGVALLAAFVAPQAWACDLPPPETATVAAVPDGETLKLTDGKTVKLIGAKAPMPPLGWRGDDPWPFVDEAREALEGLAANKTVELRFGGRRTDRHGNLLAQVFVVSGEQPLWL
jgi:endonuclease YncB( thermonuclease family)